MVETLLYQQADDPVGIEDEVSALRLLVADDPGGTSEGIHQLSQEGNHSREQRDQLGRLREDGDGVKLNPGRDDRRGLLALRAVVGTDTLGRRALEI